MWTDTAFLLYLSLGLVSLYGFVLFLWWWTRTSTFKVGPVYAYVMFLMLGMFVDHGTGALVRSYKFVSLDTYAAMHTSWWWSARLIISLVCVTLIAGHMSWRVFVVKEK